MFYFVAVCERIHNIVVNQADRLVCSKHLRCLRGAVTVLPLPF